MINKCFLAGYLCRAKDAEAVNGKLAEKLFIFDIDTYDVLKRWRGSHAYQKISCIALKNTFPTIKKLLDENHKGIVIIEGHVGRPNSNNNDMYVIVDKITKTVEN